MTAIQPMQPERWQRYKWTKQDSSIFFWWSCENSEEYFVEEDPGPWIRFAYYDATGEIVYWWWRSDNGRFFLEPREIDKEVRHTALLQECLLTVCTCAIGDLATAADNLSNAVRSIEGARGMFFEQFAVVFDMVETLDHEISFECERSHLLLFLYKPRPKPQCAIDMLHRTCLTISLGLMHDCDLEFLRICRRDGEHDITNLEAILQALRQNRSLKSLAIPDVGGSAFALELAKTVRWSQSLESLAIDCSAADAFERYAFLVETVALADSFNLNPGLQSLIISIADIEVCAALASIMENNTSLRSLKIHFRNFEGEGSDFDVGAALGDALAQNSTLRSLELSFCDYSWTNIVLDAGFADGFAINKKLASLIIDCGHMKSLLYPTTPYISLASVLHHNIGVNEFRLSGSYDSTDAEVNHILAEALRGNMSVTRCELDIDLQDAPSVEEALEMMLSRNAARDAAWRPLASLARYSRNTGFRTLKESWFRSILLTFSLPAGSSIVPKWYFGTR